MHHLATHVIKILLPFFAEWGYLIVFLFSVIESFPLAGIIIPGASVVVLGGLLSKGGVLSFPVLVLVATLGAWLGDLISYMIGRHYGYAFLQKYGKYIFLTEDRLEQFRELVKKHPAKTIILSRFNSLTRSIGPFASGASHIPLRSYLSLSFLSSFIWAFSHALFGVIFGQGIQALSHYTSFIFIFAVILSFLVFYSYRLVNRNHQVFRKYHIYTLVANIFSIFLFASSLEDVIRHHWLSWLDMYFYNVLPQIQSPALTKIMIFITHLGDPVNLLIASLILILFMIYRKAWYGALLAFLSLASGVWLQYMIKNITDIGRPMKPLVPTLYASFPSGHATMITIFAVLLFWTFAELFKTRAAKNSFAAVLVVFVSLVCFSRIYLQAHWVSDVVAGVALGIFSVTFFMLLLRGTVWSQEWLIRVFRKHQKPI